jgi:alkylation response protein AidB-like acyl-CoA dehydrogenase
VLWGAGLPANASSAVVHDGLVVTGASNATRFVWLTADSVRAAAADSVTMTPAGGLDPSLGVQRATVTGHGEIIGDARAAEHALAAGRRALASHLCGAADQMLTDTVAYVLERQQYGRPIGSFQSVKHRLADVKVATAAARAATAAAWEHHDGPDGSTLAIAAKCLAGRAQATASTHCFQVHGGIAFTAEHGFQTWVRRGLVLDTLMGSHAQLTIELGRRLIAAGAVPRVPGFREGG